MVPLMDNAGMRVAFFLLVALLAATPNCGSARVACRA